MNSILAVFSAFALAYLGMTGLALAMDRHHRQMFPSRHLPSTRARYAMRFASWGLLGLSAWACAHAWGAAVGAVAWFGVLMVAVLLLVWLLPYAPRWAGRLALLACCTAPAKSDGRKLSRMKRK